jgi:aspartate carbamoyltransferase catalytic subunit
MRTGRQSLLAIEGLCPENIIHILDLADGYVERRRQRHCTRGILRGNLIINCFFEDATGTRTSCEVAGTATILNATHPNVSVMRHPESGTAPPRHASHRSQ